MSIKLGPWCCVLCHLFLASGVHKIFPVDFSMVYLILNESSNLRFLLTALIGVPNFKSKGPLSCVTKALALN